MAVRDELAGMYDAISLCQLPRSLYDLIGDLYDPDRGEFLAQESVLHDYKAGVPDDFVSSYGAGIIRLALAFYNTYGGIIIFGVDDRSHQPLDPPGRFDIETFNRLISDYTGHNVECLCQSYLIAGLDCRGVLVVLVPRRRSPAPAALLRKVDKYGAGTIFVRVRHEVLNARPSHYPLLYSSRALFPQSPDASSISIQKSLPPAFATMKSFIGRDDLLNELWTWLTTGKDPRRYLYGPGGSGKSTLAYEFAASITNTFGGVVLPNGDAIDYVLYLSAKETEFNVLAGREQDFLLRDFSTATEQAREILYHSGFMSEAELNDTPEDAFPDRLAELFNSFNGLIVLDDIDALSRASRDTGEEQVFIAAVRAAKVTRVLYTLRFPPSSALNVSVNVPGLKFETEYCEFVEGYAAQLGVQVPTPQELVAVFEETEGLPLLVELAVGLRRHFSSYSAVLEKMQEIGGDGIRSYLYRREYDRIRSDRTKLLLALLSITDAPLDIVSIEKLLGATSEHIRDSLAEVAGVFVVPRETREGDVVHELADPAKPFIRAKNSQLRFFSQLERKVKYFSQGRATATSAERVLITQLYDLVRTKRWEEVRLVGDNIPSDDVRLANPQIRSFLGQAYAAAGGASAEKAREHFRAAEGMGAKDVHMMRSWYYLECNGSNFQESQKVCRKVMSDEAYSSRIKSDFITKLADTYYQQARKIGGSNPERAQLYLIKSVSSLNEAINIGRDERQFNMHLAFSWLDRALGVLFRFILNDPEDAFRLVKDVIETKYDFDAEVAEQFEYYIANLRAGSRTVGLNSLFGLSKRYGADFSKMPRVAERFPIAMRLVALIQEKFEDLHKRSGNKGRDTPPS
jgi:hypothetical protein